MSERANDYFADAAERRAFIEGMRNLVAFLDEHPDVPVPRFPGEINVHCAGTDEQIVAAVVSAAEAMGVEPKLQRDGHHLRAALTFGPIEYDVIGISKRSRTEFDLRERLGREAFDRLRDRSLGDSVDGEVVDATQVARRVPELAEAVTAR